MLLLRIQSLFLILLIIIIIIGILLLRLKLLIIGLLILLIQKWLFLWLLSSNWLMSFFRIRLAATIVDMFNLRRRRKYCRSRRNHLLIMLILSWTFIHNPIRISHSSSCLINPLLCLSLLSLRRITLTRRIIQSLLDWRKLFARLLVSSLLILFR